MSSGAPCLTHHLRLPRRAGRFLERTHGRGLLALCGTQKPGDPRQWVVSPSCGHNHLAVSAGRITWLTHYTGLDLTLVGLCGKYNDVSGRQYFRAMTPTEYGLPLVGPGKRRLGVLPTETTMSDGTFGPGTGGMSVSPDSPWHVPHHRRPRGMGKGATGPAEDWVFGIEQDALSPAALAARPDPSNPERHAFIEPTSVMTLPAYAAALSATQWAWRCAWP